MTLNVYIRSPIVFAYSSMFGGAPTLQTTFGTSASAPIVASFITAVNDARLAAGKGPVGWINPAVRIACYLMSDIID